MDTTQAAIVDMIGALPPPTMSIDEAEEAISRIRGGAFECTDFLVDQWYDNMRFVVRQLNAEVLPDETLKKRFDHKVYAVAHILFKAIPNLSIDESGAASSQFSPFYWGVKCQCGELIKTYEELAQAIQDNDPKALPEEFVKIWSKSRKMLHFSTPTEKLPRHLSLVWKRLCLKKADAQLANKGLMHDGLVLEDKGLNLDIYSFTAIYSEILARALDVKLLSSDQFIKSNQKTIMPFVCYLAFFPLSSSVRVIVNTVGYGDLLQRVDRSFQAIVAELHYLSSDSHLAEKKVQGLATKHLEFIETVYEVVTSLDEKKVMGAVRLFFSSNLGTKDLPEPSWKAFTEMKAYAPEALKEARAYLRKLNPESSTTEGGD